MEVRDKTNRGCILKGKTQSFGWVGYITVGNEKKKIRRQQSRLYTLCIYSRDFLILVGFSHYLTLFPFVLVVLHKAFVILSISYKKSVELYALR